MEDKNEKTLTVIIPTWFVQMYLDADIKELTKYNRKEFFCRFSIGINKLYCVFL